MCCINNIVYTFEKYEGIVHKNECRNEILMALIRNTLIFLDTGFFKHHKPTDNAYKDFLQYSKDEKIVLCTSHICLREWRSQIVGEMQSYVRSVQGLYAEKRRNSLLADALLHNYQLVYPDESEIESVSIQVIEKFVNDHKIRIYNPREDHIERTFDAYFNGDPPYLAAKAKKDIPDSWVFEAAKDARFDKENKEFQNKFSIGNDKQLNDHLEALGLKPITKSGLLERLQREEDEFALGEQEIAKTLTNVVTTPQGTELNNGLKSVLGSAINPEIYEIYVRLLGYTHWFSGPAKKDLFSVIESRGFNRQLIEASATILSQASLELIEDTGNHFLPKNKAVCEEAANLIMEEILEILG